jgi:hypothetical protein
MEVGLLYGTYFLGGIGIEVTVSAVHIAKRNVDVIVKTS